MLDYTVLITSPSDCAIFPALHLHKGLRILSTLTVWRQSSGPQLALNSPPPSLRLLSVPSTREIAMVEAGEWLQV